MYILFDIGGTHMRVAASDGQQIIHKHIVQTPPDFKGGLALFTDIAADLAGRHAIKMIVGGIAGPLNKAKSRLTGAPNLPGWNHQPLKLKLKRICAGRVYIENDTAMAGLGEAVFGAGQGKSIVVYYTVSTGVGGVRIVNQQIDVHAIGFEPGHQVISYQRLTGQRSLPELVYLEDYISGHGLNVRYQMDPRLIKNSAVWKEAAKWLALGLNNSIVHWSPQVVVLGGALINSGAISLTEVRNHLKKIVRIFPSLPLIKKSKLGDDSGLYGTLAYLKNQNDI